VKRLLSGPLRCWAW